MNWLFIPLRDEDVLVTGERVLYRQRRHWAALFPDLFQFLAVLFLHTSLAMRGTTGLGTVLVFGIVVSVIVLRPLFAHERWETWQLIMMAIVALWAFQSRPSIMGLATLVLFAMGVRFLVSWLRWAVYQRTYLTDRRLMSVDGFMGIRVDSMPRHMVTDVMLRRSALGEMLGYGTFRVETAGQEQALTRLDFLLDPEGFHDLVVSGPRFN